MFKALEFGGANEEKNRTLFLEMCEKANLSKKVGEEEVWLPTLSTLQAMSYPDDKVFNDRCFSFYLSIEEDDWNPSKEICAICAYMKVSENRSWNTETKEWEKWKYDEH
jgi:hypothetical protein